MSITDERLKALREDFNRRAVSMTGSLSNIRRHQRKAVKIEMERYQDLVDALDELIRIRTHLS